MMRAVEPSPPPHYERIVTTELLRQSQPRTQRTDCKQRKPTQVLYTNGISSRSSPRRDPRSASTAKRPAVLAVHGIVDDSTIRSGTSSPNRMFIDQFKDVVHSKELSYVETQERRSVHARPSEPVSRKESTAFERNSSHSQPGIWNKLAAPRQVPTSSNASTSTASKYAPTTRMLEEAAAAAREQRLYELQKDQLTFRPNINRKGEMAQMAKSRYMSSSRMQRDASMSAADQRDVTTPRSQRTGTSSPMKHLVRGVRDYEKEKHEHYLLETRECTFQPNLRSARLASASAGASTSARDRSVSDRLYAEARLRQQRAAGVPVVQRDGAWVYSNPKTLPTITLQNNISTPPHAAVHSTERKTVQLADEKGERVRIIPAKKAASRPLNMYVDPVTYTTEPVKPLKPQTAPTSSTTATTTAVTTTTATATATTVTPVCERPLTPASAPPIAMPVKSDATVHSAKGSSLCNTCEQEPISSGTVAQGETDSCLTDEEDEISFSVVG